MVDGRGNLVSPVPRGPGLTTDCRRVDYEYFRRVVADVEEVVIGYLIYPEYRGRGHGSAALDLFVRHLFATRPD